MFGAKKRIVERDLKLLELINKVLQRLKLLEKRVIKLEEQNEFI